ncbi:Aste57867_14359 [Aphanomyces stellatus]|uniref:Aste57867_14359 protein n=1 Tax=Aphanomyces stellatus TaxID=120398 RepID=A0A485L0E9_9STRA|nr:hypothetical protein As57867_014305 [Aphanomyces stellatus]VFT91182.1 Aste57867_14359 [Aphanomyces stellatus]
MSAAAPTAMEAADAASPPPNFVLQEETYTHDYLAQVPDDGYVHAEVAWLDLLQRHRHLYFDVKAPLVQYSLHDKRPRYCSAKQLHEAAMVVEESTAHIMAMQQRLLREWHAGATRFQAAWRGYMARKRVKAAMWRARIKKTERLFMIAQGIRRMREARRVRRTLKAVHHVKWLVARAHASMRQIQRLVRLYLFKCRRWNAAAQLQRWYRSRTRQKCLATALARLHGFLKRQRRNVLLEEYASAAVAARRQDRERRQAAYFSMKPDHVIVHRLVAARKAKLHEALVPRRMHGGVQNARSRSEAVLPLPMATNSMMARAFAMQSQARLAKPLS